MMRKKRSSFGRSDLRTARKKWSGVGHPSLDVILGLVPRICDRLILRDVDRSSGQARG
ncbi:hypothetical protein AGR7C_Cc70058 [Agrobacterium deltaense Zutra 3/1]|uniref:Uncharacterized protein n=1 Tax=Agrobacterium deltaense Zutra 3/1 TaxID=1183427 RepID=A0A1S7QL36_9HYPH|nr:hypothetical protein AGR7C_Cc70058 [Agrobacterium deltaense Zutra 3/1]